jgi:hypothetical protein
MTSAIAVFGPGLQAACIPFGIRSANFDGFFKIYSGAHEILRQGMALGYGGSIARK